MDKAGFDNLKRIIKGEEPKKKLQVGYEGKKDKRPTGEDREAGEVWEENGKKWKKTEEGRVERVSSMGKNTMPWLCPECGEMMNGSKDRKVWYQRGTCLNCLVDYHTELRRKGKFDQFAFRKRLLSAKDWYEDQIEEYEDFIKKIGDDPEYVHSDGRVDEWSNEIDTDELMEEYEEFLEDYKERLDNSIQEYENKYGESLDEWEEPE